MSRAEIKKHFDAIVDFAETEKFLDTPVKRYSSGMYVRLAFAVAAYLEPEILVVDEVLAVGDAQFQKKCLGKMEDVSKNEGRTVIFVSHNLDAIQRLCNKSILLFNGAIIADEQTDYVLKKYNNEYLDLIAEKNIENISNISDSTTIISARCVDSFSRVKDVFSVTEDVCLKFTYKVKFDNLKFTHGIRVFNEIGVNIFNSHDTTSEGKELERKSDKIYSVQCTIPKHLLNEGTFTVSFALFVQEPFIIYNNESDILRFKTIDLIEGVSTRGEYLGGFPGSVRPLLTWDLKC